MNQCFWIIFPQAFPTGRISRGHSIVLALLAVTKTIDDD
jgi:hypothetical protein